MIVLMLIVAIFLLTFLLAYGLVYLLMGGQTRTKNLMTRIQAIQEATVRNDQEALRVLKTDLDQELPFLSRWMATLPGFPQVSLFLEQAAIKLDVETFLALSLALGLGVALLVLVAGYPVLVIAVLAPAAAAIPTIVVHLKRQSRFRQFEELFPDAIDQLARAVRAGHAFTSGFELIGKELPDPLGHEFRTTYAQQNLGVPLQTALQNLATRVPLPDVRFFVAAVQIQRESGGNLGEVLDSLGQVVRERFKLMRQIRVFTAEGRLSMYILMAMPFVAAFAMYMLNPEYLMPLIEDPRGQVALLVAAVMQVIGFLIIRKMIQIKV